MDYQNLINLSEEINKEIDEKIENELFQGGKPLDIKNHLNPPCFNRKVKYLFLNVNPSINKEKEVLLKEYLCTIDEAFYDLTELELKTIKGKILFDFFKPHLNLIRSFDKETSIFWEDYDTFQRIYKTLRDYKGLNNDVKEVLEKIKEKLREEAKDFILFAELVYYRHKKQKDIKNVLEDNPELRKKVKEFLIKQIEYYAPEFIIITNAYVSDFFNKEVLGKEVTSEYNEVKTYEEYIFVKNGKRNKAIVFFSSMMSSGNIDKYNKKRLQMEIERVIKSKITKL